MRVLGVPVYTPAAAVSDLGAVNRLIRTLPAQLDRTLTLAEELVDIGHRVLVIAERLDQRAETFYRLGEQLDGRAEQLLAMGSDMRELGSRLDATGAEIVNRGGQLVGTGADVIKVLPSLDRALELVTPMEGAIDRLGRLVDRLPGGPNTRRRIAEAAPPVAGPAGPAKATVDRPPGPSVTS